MSQNKVIPQSSLEKYSIAGKVFLLGEYAVLAGLPALVATLPPRFELSLSVGSTQSSFFLPSPLSPLGKLSAWAVKQGQEVLSFFFEDPLQGAGGLGASTAQFAMADLAYSRRRGEESRKWSAVWKLYQELMSDVPLLPSGADLVAQWQGGIVLFDPMDGHCSDIWPIFDWSQLLVFSATQLPGRKVVTHEHLALLAKTGFPHKNLSLISSLEKIILQGLSAVRENDADRFGKALNEYAETLSEAGLELSEAIEDRHVLRSLPGVLGVKGTGAMLSDAVVVLMRSGGLQRAHLIEVAQSRGLQLLADGLSCQMGVTCLNSV